MFGHQRNGVIDKQYRWLNNTLAYALDNVFSPTEVAQIELGLRTIESISCVRFIPHTTQEDYVEVIAQPGAGCLSHAGRQGGHQQLNLELDPIKGCFQIGTIMHEFLHALGFYHLQSASDRDDYVKILWENILPNQEINFETYDTDFITDYGVPYDFESVLHYDPYKFTKNGYVTILPHVGDNFD